MTLEERKITLRTLTAEDGLVITDKETQKLRTKKLYLGAEDSTENYMEIDENTPLPEEENEIGEEETA